MRSISQTGEGEIIGIADTGLDKEHPDLQNHNIQLVSIGRSVSGDTSDPVGHGTHVTGSIIGNGAHREVK